MKTKHYLAAALLALSFGKADAQCVATGSHYTATYPGGWNLTDLGDGNNALSSDCGDKRNGTIWTGGTAAYFFTARNAKELRVSRDIPVVSNNSWTMDFTLIITGPPSAGLLNTNSPSAVLASLQTDQMSLQSGCTTPPGGDFCVSCGAYPNTNMDAIWVYLTSNIPNGCNDTQTNKNWRIVAAARDGNGTQINSFPINITSGSPGTYYIRLQRTSSGDGMVSVFANSNFSGHLAGSPQCFSIPGSVTDLDVLTHEIHSQGGCQRVFNGIIDHVKIDNGLPCLLPLTPSFTMSSTSICQGQSFTVNGSASTSGSTVPISSHLWVVEECDANGNQFGPVWYGPGISGAPSGNYVINPATVANAGVNMQCGHYYKVSLVVMNCSNPWVATSKIMYVNCPPSIRLKGSSSTICKGDPAGLTASITAGSGNYTMTWQQISPWGGTIYSGPPASISVFPTVTTTYQITVYDNVTGCSSTAQWTVTVADVDPTFSLFVNTANPNYFTVSMTANDLNGYNTSGFIYGLVIEELDGAGNPYYADNGTNCWWNYPNAETFLGYVSTGTGTFTQIPWWPANCGTAGQFLYNHTYRITRLVANDFCPTKQFSMTITPVKSGDGYTMEIAEDKGAPDMSQYLASNHSESIRDAIVISPNPSDGIFTIDLGADADGAQIVVTDAQGKQVKTFEQDGMRSVLDMTGFTKGMYIVTITSNGVQTAKKIVLE